MSPRDIAPDPALCPGHGAFNQAIKDIKEQRAEDKREFKDDLADAVKAIKADIDSLATRIEARLDKGEKKFAEQNGEIGLLRKRDQYVAGGLALIMFLAPLVIALYALFRG